MRIEFDVEGTYMGLMDCVSKMADDEEVKGYLILACDKNGFIPEELDPLLTQIPLPLFGGCFPGVLFQNRAFEKGTIVVGLPDRPIMQRIDNLSDGRDNFDDYIDIKKFNNLNTGTMFVIVDGLSLPVNSLLESIFNMIGVGISYLGGGASSLELIQKPCVFTNEGIRSDCAVLAYIPMYSGVGVAHGMVSVGGPHKVTSSSFNTISSINWQPAAQFYKDLLFKHPNYDDGMPGFFGTDAHFSLGLNRFDNERVILEPVSEGDNKELIFMKEVREGEFIDIMHVTETTMLESATNALKYALAALGYQRAPQTAITFDCISRYIFLDERFDEELNNICEANIPHIGALTLGGEVGSGGSDFLDYHNRTCVIGVFDK